MGLIQPKPFLNRLKLRHKAEGVERRRNMSKIILEQGTPFPKPISYEDIDMAFFNWVDKTLDLSYNGKRLPTYRLFSNQRISEYSQTWENLDESGNIIMNFKTITRENNPQHGESQGGFYNVPGHRDYAMFYVPVLQENGEEAYDLYSMKQPVPVNFNYTINLVCNKYELLNRFNEMIHYEFSGLECYIEPNGHPMPMFLDSINDESEYTIDDRKFYSQTFVIKLMGYIIRKDDYKVTHLPSRLVVRFLDVDEKIGDKKKRARKSSNDLPPVSEVEKIRNSLFDLPYLDDCEILNMFDNRKKPLVILKEEELEDNCCIYIDEDYYYNKILKVIVNFPECEKEVSFTIDNDMVLTSVEIDNVYDFKMFINDEYADMEWDVRLVSGDNVKVKISRDDEYKDAVVTLIGYDPDVVIDKRYNPESELDVIPDEEHIIVNAEEDNNENK